ncbi:DUF1491 family protein [Novosphingobium sp. Gsoil 351]|uniref:DUF1491 family protein n=1 Tax=Novosphingobium sp. Gsoil 351 TaxID=2675225 RepID=UPI0012B4F395|nr:DUF1491 family protein [Novosphingobium sp. Gsoil 351]QGN54878.1 DUF1491 family protein [Novosphingobium sp. Gsoil 351]
MSEEARLPTHLEVAGLMRRVAGAGGFATIIAKGERDAGTILLVLRDSRTNPTLYERMPQPDGIRAWTLNRTQDPENKTEFDEYLTRRAAQDDDLWIVELDVPNPERFIRDSPTAA